MMFLFAPPSLSLSLPLCVSLSVCLCGPVSVRLSVCAPVRLCVCLAAPTKARRADSETAAPQPEPPQGLEKGFGGFGVLGFRCSGFRV